MISNIAIGITDHNNIVKLAIQTRMFFLFQYMIFSIANVMFYDSFILTGVIPIFCLNILEKYEVD